MSAKIVDPKKSRATTSIRGTDVPLKAVPRSVVSPILPTEHLETQVREIAQHLGEIRRIQSALSEQYGVMLKRVDEIVSSPAEMDADWTQAWALTCLRLIEGSDLVFTQLEPRAYPMLGTVWLERIKELKSYYLWRAGGSEDPAENYSRASAALRHALLDREQASVHDFEPVKRYLEDQFLQRGSFSALDERKPATQQLIKTKAQRIYEVTGDADERANWFRARLYTTMFYENIVGAVLDNNEQKIRTILKAFEFSKAPENRYLIMNGFEAIVAVYFLEKNVLHHVLTHPEWYDFSMEAVTDWPESIPLPAGLRYVADSRQLILDGMMTAEDKGMLLGMLTNPQHRDVVERLWAQSQMRPFDEQIL